MSQPLNTMQAALPCLLFAAPHPAKEVSTLDLRGGTDAAMAPPVDYMLHVLLPTLRRLFGIDIQGEVCTGIQLIPLQT